MRVAGLISGTSVDGIDVAVIDVDEKTMLFRAHGTVPYQPDVRDAILAVSNAATHTAAIARLNFLLGDLFAEALTQVCVDAGLPLESIELIGSHGQTIFHEGEPFHLCGDAVASTLQIGDPAVIAARTGIATIGDFRVADMAAGGKGAPLVPFLDYRLFRSDRAGRVALNIGGIANVTIIPAAAATSDVIAFDTGPGNMVMDQLAPPYDRDGQKARAGRINEALLEELLAAPYFALPPPKTAGREQYGAEFLKSGIDITTAAEFTARTIALALAPFEDQREIIVSGGGAHNSYLMERLRANLPGRTVATSAEYGIDIDAKEAVLFAVLAYETYHGRPSNIPSATGALRPAILGKICRP
jgi:anhydro-N-acetylmuramic acid kinase